MTLLHSFRILWERVELLIKKKFSWWWFHYSWLQFNDNIQSQLRRSSIDGSAVDYLFYSWYQWEFAELASVAEVVKVNRPEHRAAEPHFIYVVCFHRDWSHGIESIPLVSTECVWSLLVIIPAISQSFCDESRADIAVRQLLSRFGWCADPIIVRISQSEAISIARHSKDNFILRCSLLNQISYAIVDILVWLIARASVKRSVISGLVLPTAVQIVRHNIHEVDSGEHSRNVVIAFAVSPGARSDCDRQWIFSQMFLYHLEE